MTTPADTVDLISEEMDEVCNQCASLDFESFLLSGMKSSGWGQDLLALGPQQRDSTCPACRLFNARVYRQLPDDNLLAAPCGENERFAILCPAFDPFEGGIGTPDLRERIAWPGTSSWPLPSRNFGLLVVSKAMVADFQSDTAFIGTSRKAAGRHLILPVQPSVPNPPPPGVTTGLRINEHQVDYAQIQNWLRRCDADHTPRCSRPGRDGDMEIECIDCVTRDIVMLPAEADYFALSYTWGAIKHPTAVEAARKLPPDERLAQVIRDAMTVVRELGRRYLWVDQYCIDQSNEELKARQVLHMNQIYEQAYATIVAGAGADADYGLPGVGKRPRRKQQAAQLTSALTLVPAPTPLDEVLWPQGWISRGWTYQEAVLSRRLLVFTDEQVYFVCAVKTWCETLVSTSRGRRSSRHFASDVAALQTDYFSLGRTNTDNIRRYRPGPTTRTLNSELVVHIEEYSRRALTYQEDALNAFRGVLARWSFHSYHGVPFAPYRPDLLVPSDAREIGFLLFLAWLPVAGRGRRRVGFPSWSWVSWQGEVDLALVHQADVDAEDIRQPHAQLRVDGLGDSVTTPDLSRGTILPEQSLRLRMHTLIIHLRFQPFLGRNGEPRAHLCLCHPGSEHSGTDTPRKEVDVSHRELYWDTVHFDEPSSVDMTGRLWECLLLFATRWLGGPSVRLTFLIVDIKGGLAFRVGLIHIIDNPRGTFDSILQAVPHETRGVVLV